VFCLLENITLCYCITQLVFLYQSSFLETFHGIELACVLFLDLPYNAKSPSSNFFDYFEWLEANFLATLKQSFIFANLVKIFTNCNCLREGSCSFKTILINIEIRLFFLFFFLFFQLFWWRILKKLLFINLEFEIRYFLICDFSFIFSFEKYYFAFLRWNWSQNLFWFRFVCLILNVMSINYMLIDITDPYIN